MRSILWKDQLCPPSCPLGYLPSGLEAWQAVYTGVSVYYVPNTQPLRLLSQVQHPPPPRHVVTKKGKFRSLSLHPNPLTTPGSPPLCLPQPGGGKRNQSSSDPAAQERCLKANNDPITAGRAVG